MKAIVGVPDLHYQSRSTAESAGLPEASFLSFLYSHLYDF